VTFSRLFIFLFTISVLSFAHSSYAADKVIEQPSLNMGLFVNSLPEVTRADVDVAFNFWAEEIGKQEGITVMTQVYTDINAMRRDFDADQINFIIASPLPLLNEFDREQLAEGYKVVWGSLAEDNLLVVTRKQSKLHDLIALKNKQLSIVKNEPISAMYADILALDTFGLDAKQVFNKINYEPKSTRLVLNLFFKRTDVILVYQQLYDLTCELNPQIKRDTQVINVLPNLPRVLGYFHKRVNPEFRELVLTVVERLETHPRGQQLLALFQADKVVRSNIADLKSTEELQQRYLQLLDTKRKHQ